MNVNNIEDFSDATYKAIHEVNLSGFSFDVDENSDVKMKKVALEMADKDVKRESMRFYPTLDFSTSYTYNNSGGDLNGTKEESKLLSFGLSLRVPLAQGGSVVSGYREKTEVKYQTLNEYKQMQIDMQNSAYKLYYDVLSSQTRMNALENALQSAALALEANKKGFAIGTKTSMDLLDAKETYYTVEITQIQTRLKLLLSYYYLEILKNGLDSEQVIQVR